MQAGIQLPEYTTGEVSAPGLPQLQVAPTEQPRRQRQYSIRSFLMLLAAGVLLPMALLAGIMTLRTLAAERSRLEQSVLSAAETQRALVEREVFGLGESLETLATSPALLQGNLAAFHQQAQQVAAMQHLTVVLRDSAGGQVANSMVPFGTALPPSSLAPEVTAAALRHDRPVVTSHFRGAVTGSPGFAVVAGVSGAVGGPYTLHLAVPSDRLRELLRLGRPGRGWRSLVLDRNGIVLAHSNPVPGAVGHALPEGLWMPRTDGEAGATTDLDGEPVFAVARRAREFGWTVLTLAPAAVVTGPLRRDLWYSAATALLLASLALAAAALLGQRLRQDITGLAAAAAAVQRGEPVRPPPSMLREVNDVGQVLATTGSRLAEQALDRAAADQRQRLILHELNHRVKNILAAIQALASLTAREAPDVETYRARLTERLQGLAQTQALLTRGGWHGAQLRDLLRAELGMFQGEGGDRVWLNGREVMLASPAVVPLGMLLHELATNAAKYGALSTSGGLVHVTWTLRPDGEGQALDLLWEESGGPPVTPPETRGFGTEMIERGLARQLSAQVRMDYRREGLRFTLSMPLAAPKA